MAGGKLVRKNIGSGEMRPFKDGMGQMELVETDDGMVGRATFPPGWRWSAHVKPIAGTESCQASHMGYVISGRMRIEMDDGSAEEFGAGDVMIAPPGHDAWTMGDEPCIVIDWQGVRDYAKA
jgi:quercetin dioxygenase-like cupin family protein